MALSRNAVVLERIIEASEVNSIQELFSGDNVLLKFKVPKKKWKTRFCKKKIAQELEEEPLRTGSRESDDEHMTSADCIDSLEWKTIESSCTDTLLSSTKYGDQALRDRTNNFQIYTRFSTPIADKATESHTQRDGIRDESQGVDHSEKTMAASSSPHAQALQTNSDSNELSHLIPPTRQTISEKHCSLSQLDESSSMVSGFVTETVRNRSNNCLQNGRDDGFENNGLPNQYAVGSMNPSKTLSVSSDFQDLSSVKNNRTTDTSVNSTCMSKGNDNSFNGQHGNQLLNATYTPGETRVGHAYREGNLSRRSDTITDISHITSCAVESESGSNLYASKDNHKDDSHAAHGNLKNNPYTVEDNSQESSHTKENTSKGILHSASIVGNDHTYNRVYSSDSLHVVDADNAQGEMYAGEDNHMDNFYTTKENLNEGTYRVDDNSQDSSHRKESVSKDSLLAARDAGNGDTLTTEDISNSSLHMANAQGETYTAKIKHKDGFHTPMGNLKESTYRIEKNSQDGSYMNEDISKSSSLVTRDVCSDGPCSRGFNSKGSLHVVNDNSSDGMYARENSYKDGSNLKNGTYRVQDDFQDSSYTNKDTSRGSSLAAKIIYNDSTYTAEHNSSSPLSIADNDNINHERYTAEDMCKGKARAATNDSLQVTYAQNMRTNFLNMSSATNSLNHNYATESSSDNSDNHVGEDKLVGTRKRVKRLFFTSDASSAYTTNSDDEGRGKHANLNGIHSGAARKEVANNSQVDYHPNSSNCSAGSGSAMRETSGPFSKFAGDSPSARFTDDYESASKVFVTEKSVVEEKSQVEKNKSVLLRRKSELLRFKRTKPSSKKKTGKSHYSVYDPDLSSPNASPKHYAETTHSNKTPKPSRLKHVGLKGEVTYKSPKILKPNTASDEELKGLRRSKRTRLPCLRHFVGERPIYERDKQTGASIIVGLEKKDPAEDSIITFFTSKLNVKGAKRRKAGNKREKTKKKRLSLPAKIDSDVSMSDDEMRVRDLKTGKDVDRVLTSSVDKAPLFCLDGTIASEDDPVKICKLLDGSNSGNDKTSFGAITLAASAEKPSSFLRGYSLTFYLQEGMVILCINGAYKKFLKSGGCFIVPDGNSYELKNVGKVPAKLVFFTLKDDDSLT
ncbi:uncharacterized protein DDB_G0286591-like [Watersipora subatra]|uniref:uncharacterized protein DDB_G0286591-like n=1 Tax=Watersipora subatra TaxID=2589382 RepID=UPI00355C7F60